MCKSVQIFKHAKSDCSGMPEGAENRTCVYTLLVGIPEAVLRCSKMAHHTPLKAKLTAPRRKQPCSKFLHSSNYSQMLKC